MSCFTPLDIMRIGGPGDLWRLQRDLTYDDGRLKVTVPAGMIADGNSGPFKLGTDEPPGWLRDYLYRIDCPLRVTRIEADGLFFDALRSEGRSWAGAYVEWATVRTLGSPYWHQKRVF